MEDFMEAKELLRGIQLKIWKIWNYLSIKVKFKDVQINYGIISK
jgi:hypothetical protein